MEKTVIKQFTLRDELEIISTNHEAIGGIVSLVQLAGSMHFQFSMTPNQARKMAEALTQHADALEA